MWSRDRTTPISNVVPPTFRPFRFAAGESEGTRPKRVKIAVILLFPLFAASCAKSPARRFPIGLYDVDDPKFLKEVADNGFDTIAASPSRELARESRRQGILLLVGAPGEELSASEVRSWPVEAWYLWDEPDVHGTAASVLEGLSRKTRQWDGRPQALVLGAGERAAEYGNIADILMLDWYPVPHLKLDSLAEQLDSARRFIPREKPLWMVVQAMDWRDFPQRDPAKPRVGRFPDDAEMRFMSYLAVLHGATGLFYYTFKKPGGRTLLDYPEEWQALTRVSREMRSMQPIFEGGRRVALPFPPQIDAPESAAWRWRGRDYVVVLNRKAEVMVRVPEELLDSRWRPLFEVRRDPRDLLAKEGGAWYLPPYRVMVFESGWRFNAPAVRTW